MPKFYNFFVIYALIAILLTACQAIDPISIEKQDKNITAFTGQAMTMQYKILIGQVITSTQHTQISDIIQSTFHETDTIFNKWNPHSELSMLNHQKAKVSTPLSSSLLRLFQEADQIVKLSQGKFDPTIEPLQQLWKQKLEQGKIPNVEEIKALAPAIGWDKISFTNGIFRKDNDQIQIDFGGIAKGLCIDIIVEKLNLAGIANVFVEWGGEIRATGRHPEDRPWTVFISRLGDNNPNHSLDIVPLNDQAIATSGDYLQNWSVRLTDQGQERRVTYFHIFDPKTLQPIEASYTSVASVSVTAANCALADGLATISMMFASPNEAKDWAAGIKNLYPEVSFWIVSRSDIPGYP